MVALGVAETVAASMECVMDTTVVTMDVAAQEVSATAASTAVTTDSAETTAMVIAETTAMVIMVTMAMETVALLVATVVTATFLRTRTDASVAVVRSAVV